MEAVTAAVKSVLPEGALGEQRNEAAFLDGKDAKLRVAATEMPTPDDDEIIVKNHFVAVNPVDWKIQDLGLFIQSWPTVLGCDIAGEVVQVGSKVTQFKAGDRVLSHTISLASQKIKNGGFQRFSAAPAGMSAKIPASISYKDASVLPLALDTAAHGLIGSREDGLLGLPYPSLDPKPSGKTILVWGGSSSVGALVIQLAVAGGSKVVAVASKRNHGFVKSLGASEAIDYNDPNVVEDVVKAVQSLGGDFAGIYEAIATEDSYKYTVPIAEKLNAGVIAAVLGEPENKPEGIKVGHVFAIQPELLAPIWSDYVTQALQSGQLKAVPEALVVGKGLESVQKGFDTNKAGVSAQKVVIEI